MRTFKHSDYRPFEPGDRLAHLSLSNRALFVDYDPCIQPYASCNACLTNQMELRITYDRNLNSNFFTHSCSTEKGRNNIPSLRWRKMEEIEDLD